MAAFSCPRRLGKLIWLQLTEAGIARQLTRAFAALIPALVRSEINGRSNCAAQNLQGKHALWRRRVDGIMQGAKPAPSARLPGRRWLTDRARRSRRTTTEHIAGFDLAQQLGQYGSGPSRAGTVFFEDVVAPGSL
nr:hypothetical protein [Phyllobacterium zundukense]